MRTGEQEMNYVAALEERLDYLEEMVIDAARSRLRGVIKDLDNPILKPMFENLINRLKVIDTLLDFENDEDLPDPDQFYGTDVF